jgi:hypothetical protein
MVVSLQLLVGRQGVLRQVTSEEEYCFIRMNDATVRAGLILSGLKAHKIEIVFGFDFEICIISLLVMSKY